MRYSLPMYSLSLLLLTSACKLDMTPEYCASRANDMDCDGVEDPVDMCQGTAFNRLTDATGCSSEQLSKCSIQLVSPTHNEPLSEGVETTFRWEGSCDVYHLQFSNEPTFPAALTRTGSRTSEDQATVIATEAYWRVWGGMTGNSHGAITADREISWR